MRPITFSTDDLPSGLSGTQRAFAWVESLRSGNTIGKSEAVVPDWQSYSGKLRTAAFGEAFICRSQGTPILLKRTRKLVAIDPNDHLLLLIANGGGPIIVEQFGRKVELQPGEVTLCANDVESIASAPMGGGVLTAALPREHLLRFHKTPEELCATKLDDKGTLRSYVRDYIQLFLREEETAPDLPHSIVERYLADIVGSMCRTSAQASVEMESDGVKASRRARIMELVKQHYRDPALNAEKLAAAVNLSPRYVQLLLAEVNTTVTDVIADARLSAALSLLRSLNASYLSIAEIAFTCGFGDISTFNRRFQKKYKTTPTVVRRPASS